MTTAEGKNADETDRPKRRHAVPSHPGWVALYEDGRLVGCGHQDFFSDLAGVVHQPITYFDEEERCS